MARGTKFTEAELARIAAEHEAGSSNADESAEWSFDDGSEAGGTTSMSIRLPVSVVAALKKAAEEQGVGATVLARQWIMERLAAGGAGVQGTVKVSDLLALAFEGTQVGVGARPAKKAAPQKSKPAERKPRGATATRRAQDARPRREKDSIKDLEVSFNRS